MTAHRRVTAPALAGLLLAALPITASHADAAVKRFEHSTDIYCETATEDGLRIDAGVLRNVSAQGVETYAFAAVSNAEDTVYAYGEATDIVFEDGRIDATLELVDHDDVAFGSAHLVGSYSVGEGTTMRGRPLKMLGNQYMVQTTTVAPVAVDWQTLEVADVVLVADGRTLLDPNCDTYDMIRDDVMTAPHRLSFQAEEYTLPEPCSAAPLTEVMVIPSEGGLSLVLFGEDGLVGDANLDVSATGPQPLQWWLPDAEEPVMSEITVAFDAAGTPRTEVVTEKGQTLRTTIRPLEMSFTAGLPDGTTVSTSCGVEHSTTRIVVEPVDFKRG